VFIAGDDEEAKETVARLVRDWACGPPPAARWGARQLEGLGVIGIALGSPLA
jgi:hypothetical protein